MPYSVEINDIGTFLPRLSGPGGILLDQLEVLHAEGSKPMCITSPFSTGVPFPTSAEILAAYLDLDAVSRRVEHAEVV